MSYFVRVFSTSAQAVPVSSIQKNLVNGRLDASIEAEDGSGNEWEQFILKHGDGVEIASVERNLIIDCSLGQDELREFGDEVKLHQPTNAAQWLSQYFEKVKCIYAFQLLSGTEHKNGWDTLSAVKTAIWSSAPGIFQADAEGFSNEQDYHILWQFSESVSGLWWMGVVCEGRWIHFQMDLGNQMHRDAFLKGEIPKGLEVREGEPC